MPHPSGSARRTSWLLSTTSFLSPPTSWLVQMPWAIISGIPNYGRDYRAALVQDIVAAQDGDGCPQCGAVLRRVA